MSEKQSGVNIIASVKKQNELFKDSDMKVLHVYEIKYNETFGAIIEVDPKTFNIFMREKKVIVGMDWYVTSQKVLVCYVVTSVVATTTNQMHVETRRLVYAVVDDMKGKNVKLSQVSASIAK